MVGGADSKVAAEGIEDAYENFAPLVEKYWGPDLHNGYWPDPTDDAPLETAVARLTGMVVSKLEAGPGTRVLDIGCGNGRPAVALALESGASVTAIDVNRSALREGINHAEAQGVADRVSFGYVDALNSGFEEGEFDAALAFESSPHFELAPLLAEVSRLLRPGGRLVLEAPYARVPMTEEMLRRTEEYYSLIQAVSLDTVERHLEAARCVGLELFHFVEITDNVRPTWPAAVERLHANWDEVRRHLGGNNAQHMIDVVSRWCALREIGAMIMTLRKPVRG